MKAEDEEIRELLSGAVPPLTTPPDRVDAVAQRVRRRRRQLTNGSALAVLLLVGSSIIGPQVIAGGGGMGVPHHAADPEPVGVAACPTHTREFPDPGAVQYGGTGALVPDGAVEITLCEVRTSDGAEGPTLSDPRVLTTGVDDVLQIINALPPYPNKYGSDDPGDPSGGNSGKLRCVKVANYFDTAYLLRYLDREPVTVYLREECAVVTSGPNGRGLDWNLTSAFLDHYRAQLAAQTDPDTIPSPACAPEMPAKQLRLTPTRRLPADQISVNNPRQDPRLPTTLVAATACRYRVTDGTARLIGQEQVRQRADELRPVLNIGLDRKAKRTDCGGYPGYPPPTMVDTLTVVDATGASTGFWLHRKPCLAFADRNAELRPTSALLAAVDELLGPVPGN